MKKFLLGGLLVASASAGHAQSIATGTVYLGGSVGYSRTSSEEEYGSGNSAITRKVTTSQFQLSPAVGYFFADNLAIGANLNYTAGRTTLTGFGPGQPDSDNPDAQTTLRVGPYVQYYKMIGEQFGALGTLGAGYQSSENDAKGFYAAITPGVIFFPIPKFGISASIGNLGYERLKLDADDNWGSAKVSSFGASFGLNQLLFGGTYFFGR